MPHPYLAEESGHPSTSNYNDSDLVDRSPRRRADRQDAPGRDPRRDRPSHGAPRYANNREDFDRQQADKRYNNRDSRDLLAKAENPFQPGKAHDPLEQIVKR